MTTANLLDFDLEGLAAFCEKLGEKKFRATQLFRWIHQRGASDFSQMTDLAKSLREKLATTARVEALPVITQHESKDGTIKWLFDVGDGNAVEAVFIPEDDRGTLCVSSQAGCAVGCRFCSTGHQGFSRNLSTGEIVAQAIDAAIKACGVHPGVFSLIQGGKRDVGTALVQHPLIKAVGFTGSLAGGRALFDLCARRPEPIPFFGELGSVNPMFLLPEAMKARGGEIAKGWAGSLTMGAGQFCTNPGICVVLDGPQADGFIEAATAALEPIGAQTMLTDGIAAAYRAGRDRIAGTAGVQEVLTSMCDLRNATPYLFATTGTEWLANEVLGEEVFGPLGLIVRVSDFDEMLQIARSLHGQLTCTIHMDEGDTAHGQALMPVLERKAGRILANGFPTGVEVCDAMVHGGPYPASTNFGATSVGTLSIRRFLRPVSYQNMPQALLPGDLK